MAIPDLPELSEFLSRVRLSPDRPSNRSAGAQLPFVPAVDETGDVLQDSFLWLHYPVDTKVSFESFLERINKELKAVGHSRYDGFALFALAMRSAHALGVWLSNSERQSY